LRSLRAARAWSQKEKEGNIISGGKCVIEYSTATTIAPERNEPIGIPTLAGRRYTPSAPLSESDHCQTRSSVLPTSTARAGSRRFFYR
jgi:hypothetical protein